MKKTMNSVGEIPYYPIVKYVWWTLIF